MWNTSAGLGPETLYACSYKNWYVVSNQTNNAGAVKTYPNVHKDYNNVPINSFNYLTSTYAATTPHVGIYNVAYDIWINGIATNGCTEVMIWTENYKQVPAGSKVDTITFNGLKYDVWKTSWSWTYIAFVSSVNVTSGTINLLEIFSWIISKGWISSNSTLNQICFGVEIVSTDGKNATFYFTDFSINTFSSNIPKTPILISAKTPSQFIKNEYCLPLGRSVNSSSLDHLKNKVIIWHYIDNKGIHYLKKIIYK
jgi:hypothetical protein